MTERKPLFKNVNSFFSFDNKDQIEILPMKNEVLTKISYGLEVDETIHNAMYIYFANYLEQYINEEILSEVWGEEDYGIVYDSEKLKLRIEMNSIWNKILDVCIGSDYGYTRNFSKRNSEFNYEKFISKVKNIRMSINIIKNADLKKSEIPESSLDEEVNEKFYKNYIHYRTSFGNKDFKEFCEELIRKCDLVLNISKDIFSVSSMTIDMDTIENYLDLDKLYLYISFGFLDEIKQISNIENIEDWKLEFLVKVYNYIKRNFNTNLKLIAAPQSEKANGKIKMGNIEAIIKDFEGLLKNKQFKEKIKSIVVKEKEHKQENEQMAKPKEKVKIDKIPLKMLEGIEDIYSIQLIINGNNTIKKQIKEFNDFLLNKKQNILNFIKNDYLYDLIIKIRFLNNINLENLVLNLYLSESGSLEIKIDFISLLNSILEQYSISLDFSCYTSVEEIITVFKDTLLNYGEKLSQEDSKEEIYLKYLYYKENVDDVTYSLYVTRVVDSILELVDYVDLIKTICETNISYTEINKRIDKDKYYLSVATNLFTKLYNQYMKKEKINKEEYLFLAKYIEILREITKSGYKVQDDSISCEDLLKKYEEFISQNSLYDLDNASLYNAIATPEAKKTLFSNWKIIPNGTMDVIRFSQKNSKAKKRKSSFSRKYSEILSRKYFLDHTDYECIIEGIDGLKGYVGYVYKNGIIILEKFFEDNDESRPILGNATFVMTLASFLRHSFKSKTELQEYINAGHSDVKKKNHSSRWEQNIMDIINNWGYDLSILKSIDKLVEESKKKKGRELVWKK